MNVNMYPLIFGLAGLLVACIGSCSNSKAGNANKSISASALLFGKSERAALSCRFRRRHYQPESRLGKCQFRQKRLFPESF